MGYLFRIATNLLAVAKSTMCNACPSLSQVRPSSYTKARQLANLETPKTIINPSQADLRRSTRLVRFRICSLRRLCFAKGMDFDGVLQP